MRRTSPKSSLLGAALVALPGVVAAAPTGSDAPAGYAAETAAWRATRETRLRAPDGWLAVVGLTWLRPGANRFGSARDNDVLMPAPVAAHAGTLVLEGHTVRLEVPGAPPRALHTDATASVDTLKAGTVSWQVIERGERFGVRVRDRASARHKSFAGCVWFPIDPAYRVVAHLTPREGPTEVVVPDAAGGKQTLKSVGTLGFILGGKPQHLDPVLEQQGVAELLHFLDRHHRVEPGDAAAAF